MRLNARTREGSARFVTSRLGMKCQTVLPREVRAVLGVGPGDQVGYTIREDRVILTSVRAAAGGGFVRVLRRMVIRG